MNNRKWKVHLTSLGIRPIVWKVSFTFMAEIVNRIKELRSACGWTQEQLAQAVGVSRQSINSIERDRYVPSLELALTFARVFGCSTDQIFTLESKK
jgi:putative transcriptional regulator